MCVCVNCPRRNLCERHVACISFGESNARRSLRRTFGSMRSSFHCPKIEYPKYDNKITFDLLTNLIRSGTAHEEDQPCHLHIDDMKGMKTDNWEKFAGPEGRFCPAKVRSPLYSRYLCQLRAEHTNTNERSHDRILLRLPQSQVYEWLPNDKGEMYLQRSPANCLHCKACSIKDYGQRIDWRVPQGGGGPQYAEL